MDLDSKDVLRHTRDEFNIPSKADVARMTLSQDNNTGKFWCLLPKGALY